MKKVLKYQNFICHYKDLAAQTHPTQTTREICTSGKHLYEMTYYVMAAVNMLKKV